MVTAALFQVKFLCEACRSEQNVWNRLFMWFQTLYDSLLSINGNLGLQSDCSWFELFEFHTETLKLVSLCERDFFAVCVGFCCQTRCFGFLTFLKGSQKFPKRFLRGARGPGREDDAGRPESVRGDNINAGM